jgi:hypothetical protein
MIIYIRRIKEFFIKKSFRNKTVEETFDSIHQSNFWGSEESISGVGSDLVQTQVIIEELSKLFQKDNKINSVLDIPCGDFNWMKLVNLSEIKYVGADIVKVLIEENNKNYGNTDRQFVHLNLIKDELPSLDLILVRDCLVHLSESYIFDALRNIKLGKIKFLMTTSFAERTSNKDIQTGDWRPLNLQIAPFNFPEPLLIINENCTEGKGKYADKCLMLWRVEDLKLS